MIDIEVEEELPPVAHVTVVYTGPAAPHWDLQVRYGDQKLIDDFWARVTARLLLLPKHDPQFRRNRERVNRDAERELIICDWDLGDEESEGQQNRNGQAPTESQPSDQADEQAEQGAGEQAGNGDSGAEVAQDVVAQDVVVEAVVAPSGDDVDDPSVDETPPGPALSEEE